MNSCGKKSCLLIFTVRKANAWEVFIASTSTGYLIQSPAGGERQGDAGAHKDSADAAVGRHDVALRQPGARLPAPRGPSSARRGGNCQIISLSQLRDQHHRRTCISSSSKIPSPCVAKEQENTATVNWPGNTRGRAALTTIESATEPI